jgi:hypothetical protein
VHPKDYPHAPQLPAFMRGSRHLHDFPPKARNRADDFIKRAVRMLKFTTAYKWERSYTKEEKAFIDRIVTSTYKRWRGHRANGHEFLSCDYRRFEKGHYISLSDEPEAKAKYEEFTKMIKANDFWVRIQAARELLDRAHKMGLA